MGRSTWILPLNRLFSLTKSQSQTRCIGKMAKPNVVFVLGAPGAGKGTQCQRIVDKFGYVHLSAGDLLRAERKTPGSEHGQVIEEHIVNGTIVPVAITCSLLERAMKESEKNEFLIDGFPRNEDNLTGWNEAMGDKVNLRGVLFFHCTQEICTADNEESLRKRFVTYEQATMPIIRHFEKLNLVHQLDATKSPDEVFAEVEKIVSASQ